MPSSSPIRSFKDLIAWQKAFQLCLDVYRATQGFPAQERFGLSAELRKTARSVPCNIAEGHQRRSTLDYLRFLSIAAGSRGELETQLLLAQALGYLSPEGADKLLAACADVAKLLAALTRALRTKTDSAKP
jgi:four helix bundle protein